MMMLGEWGGEKNDCLQAEIGLSLGLNMAEVCEEGLLDLEFRIMPITNWKQNAMV